MALHCPAAFAIFSSKDNTLIRFLRSRPCVRHDERHDDLRLQDFWGNKVSWQLATSCRRRPGRFQSLLSGERPTWHASSIIIREGAATKALAIKVSFCWPWDNELNCLSNKCPISNNWPHSSSRACKWDGGCPPSLLWSYVSIELGDKKRSQEPWTLIIANLPILGW